MPRPGYSPIVRVNAMSFCLLVKLMKDSAMTYTALTEVTGLNDRTVRKWVAEMKRQGLVFVQGWEMVRAKTGSHSLNYAPMWRWKIDAKQVDVSRPRNAKTVQERNRDYRRKQKRIKEIQRMAFSASLEQLCATTP